jgi:hypothetical protein
MKLDFEAFDVIASNGSNDTVSFTMAFIYVHIIQLILFSNLIRIQTTIEGRHFNLKR